MTTHRGSLPMTEPADWIAGPPQGAWTSEDRSALPEDGHRYEIIDGVLYRMDAPSTAHQGSSSAFVGYLMMFVQFKDLGRVFHAPCDVELPNTPPDIVQPDVLVVLRDNLGIITPARIRGAPDLVVEIASPGTASYDRRKKRDAYERAGVSEYWLADPRHKTVEVLWLVNGSYSTIGVFEGAATLPSRVVPGLPVRVEQFFA